MIVKLFADARPHALLLASLCGLAAACSGEPAGGRGEQDQAANDPPGAALPLSIGGQVEAGDAGAGDAAIRCAAALDQTAERLAGMTDNPRSAEITIIRQAQAFFVDQAEAEAKARGDPGSVGADVARRKREKAGEATAQAQLAIACLRRYGDAVEGQSGAQT